MEDIKILLEFLNMPLGSTGEVFAKFRELDGAKHCGEGKQRFLYRPGLREDRVLLVAHADTVWDCGRQEIVYENGIIRNKQGGLGADDRAGCAIVWLLRDLGHSLLIVDGEESGRQGSRWLMEANADLRNEINNKHNFVIEFDRRNGKDYKCYDVGTPEFRKYIEAMTNYVESDRHSYTDICTLCRKVPGANLSVGYHNEHKEQEYLVVKEWQHTLDLSRQWLAGPGLPKFTLPRKREREERSVQQMV
jgi:hypothetical protein